MTADRLTGYTHDGLRFDVRDEGPLDGPVVVLLHGFPQTSSCWDGVVPLLHAAGYRTLAPDQRGYSPGARPRGRRRTAGAAGRRRGGAGPTPRAARSHVVGHDWGARRRLVAGGRAPRAGRAR